MNLQLLLIDPQKSFCVPTGSLYVQGADDDMKRLAAMIKRLSSKLDDIHVTLDSHHQIDIAHPLFWIDSSTGKHPGPFTIISDADVAAGKYTTTNPSWLKRATEYVTALARNGRYPLCIWPPHCIIGSNGYSIHDDLFDALTEWEVKNFAMTDKVTKGSNFWTEHYSAVQADVPDPADPGTMLNIGLIQTLQDADVIGIAGEALSHCVANTITDIANNFGEENIKKFVLLTDATSNVGGFEFLGENFIKDMTARGMQLSTTVDFFK